MLHELDVCGFHVRVVKPARFHIGDELYCETGRPRRVGPSSTCAGSAISSFDSCHDRRRSRRPVKGLRLRADLQHSALSEFERRLVGQGIEEEALAQSLWPGGVMAALGGEEGCRETERLRTWDVKVRLQTPMSTEHEAARRRGECAGRQESTQEVREEVHFGRDLV